MSNNGKITPRKLSGFMELAPSKQVIFNNMVDNIRKAFEDNCFLPLDTPVLELSEILLAKSGGEIDKEVYAFKKGDTDICMRYDLTVPLARYVAMNSESLNYPFKRYQIGKVYRGEKAQRGRFREFYQCDADIIGNGELSMVADAECVNLLCEIYDKLNLSDIVVHVSNRNILFGMIESLGYQDKASEVLTILDKLNKIGKENTISCLKDMGLKEKDSTLLVNLTSKSGIFEKVLSEISTLSQNITFVKGVNELRELNSYLLAMGAKNYILDIGIIRGQNYYTGTVFEGHSKSHPEFGSVGGGGRYDNLAGYFTDKHLPGVGVSIGLTRLFDLLDSNDMLGQVPQTTAEATIIPLGDTLTCCLQLGAYLKSQGIKSEVSYENRSFKAKLKDANRREVPFVIIVGDEEVANKKYMLKNMKASTQEAFTQEEIVNEIKKSRS